MQAMRSFVVIVLSIALFSSATAQGFIPLTIGQLVEGTINVPTNASATTFSLAFQYQYPTGMSNSIDPEGQK